MAAIDPQRPFHSVLGIYPPDVDSDRESGRINQRLKHIFKWEHNRNCGNSRYLIARLFSQLHTIGDQQANSLPIGLWLQLMARLAQPHWVRMRSNDRSISESCLGDP